MNNLSNLIGKINEFAVCVVFRNSKTGFFLFLVDGPLTVEISSTPVVRDVTSLSLVNVPLSGGVE